MSFTSSEKGTDFPLLWYIEKKSTGGKMALEIQDEMISKGVSKRVLFDPADSLWTMLIEFNNNRQGTRIHAASMFRDTAITKIIKITRPKEKRNIEGYKCNKIILESDKYNSELWVTEQIRFNLGYIYKLLSHCGMMSDVVRKGDWFIEKNIKGMILEVISTKKSNGERYSMKISNIKPGNINETFFDISGFRISDIPEGQNCGGVIDED